MRTPNDIIAEMTELEKLIEEGVSLQKKYKDNFAINLTVNQNKHRYAFLEKELAESFAKENRHSLHFVIENVEAYVPIVLDRFVNSVKAFQDMAIFISKKMYKQGFENIEFAFSHTYPSSFGVSLCVNKKDDELISKTYQTLEKTFDIFDALNNDEKTIVTIKELKDKDILSVVKKFYDEQLKYGNEIVLKWGDQYNSNRKVEIKKERISYISGTLGNFISIPDERVTIDCLITGISLVRQKIEFDYEGKHLSGEAHRNEIYAASTVLGKTAKIDAILSQTFNETTGEYNKKWKILTVY